MAFRRRPPDARTQLSRAVRRPPQGDDHSLEHQCGGNLPKYGHCRDQTHRAVRRAGSGRGVRSDVVSEIRRTGPVPLYHFAARGGHRGDSRHTRLQPRGRVGPFGAGDPVSGGTVRKTGPSAHRQRSVRLFPGQLRALPPQDFQREFRGGRTGERPLALQTDQTHHRGAARLHRLGL